MISSVFIPLRTHGLQRATYDELFPVPGFAAGPVFNMFDLLLVFPAITDAMHRSSADQGEVRTARLIGMTCDFIGSDVLLRGWRKEARKWEECRNGDDEGDGEEH